MVENGLKRTPLYEEHLLAGARFGEFAGFAMPLWYGGEGIQKEAMAVRKNSGLFDISHMGKFIVFGTDAERFLQRLTTRNILKLKNQRAVYGFFCKENGGIIDDAVIYKLSSFALRLVVNGSNSKKVFDWIQLHSREFSVNIFDETSSLALLALQGPMSEMIIRAAGLEQEFIPKKPYDISYDIIWRGVPVSVSRTGYTGEDGFEIMVPSQWAKKFWQHLLEAGGNYIHPCGFGARDILRLEAGLPLYGHEISELINPLEAGLERFVSMRKRCNFIGKFALRCQKKQGIRRKLIGFEVPSGRIARQWCPILINGEDAGYVTSGTFSPILQKSIGMGYVGCEFSEIGTGLDIDIRGAVIRAKIVAMPFYKRAA